MKQEKKSLIEHFSVIPDPRINRKKQHLLIDIIVIAICGMISGCDNFVEIEDYGNSKHDWLKGFLKLPNGIPSHDTFGRVFSLVNALDIQKSFYEWTRSIPVLNGEIINLDGKYLTSSHGATKNKKSIFGMVNAWASEAGVALAQIRTDYEKKDEKQAFRDLIDFLELKGSLVTIDANGCHADIANKITAKEADFLLCLKLNQRSLHNQVKSIFQTTNENEFSSFESLNKGHGRIEKRSCIALDLSEDFLHSLKVKNKKRNQEEWKGLKSVCKITSEREVKGKTTIETRYYLSSLEADAQRMLYAARSHWAIENKLHWVLDVAFNEDACRVRNGFAGENLAVIRQLAVNLLRQEKSTKRSMKGKRAKCGWENDYLEKIITGFKPENIVF